MQKAKMGTTQIENFIEAMLIVDLDNRAEELGYK